ncbi:hypothetical protein H072_10800 [Dactylellina haptotyla CBS 200.50]|uniref:Azaphilone pigments biosynthesis cluster protein L N-terminal domain-containing protein n=1 Tax=Dactylellina haptotyla (strain CBS 200.50) TaxID=1284197 RepID=S8B9K1_DACHA|nr:hypothetical protein H072_10800 [Dactylellina haptotyla CBS 200.50]
MEAVGIAANIVGLAAVTAHLSRLISQDISSFKSAPKTITSIKNELEILTDLLEYISTLGTGVLINSLDDTGKTCLSKSLNQCTEQCQAFEKKLEKYTKKGSNGNLSTWSKIVVVWDSKATELFLGQLETCKSTLGITLGAIQLYNSTKNHDLALDKLTEMERGLNQTLISTKQNLQEVLEAQAKLQQDFEGLLAERLRAMEGSQTDEIAAFRTELDEMLVQYQNAIKTQQKFATEQVRKVEEHKRSQHLRDIKVDINTSNQHALIGSLEGGLTTQVIEKVDYKADSVGALLIGSAGAGGSSSSWFFQKG